MTIFDVSVDNSSNATSSIPFSDPHALDVSNVSISSADVSTNYKVSNPISSVIATILATTNFKVGSVNISSTSATLASTTVAWSALGTVSSTVVLAVSAPKITNLNVTNNVVVTAKALRPIYAIVQNSSTVSLTVAGAIVQTLLGKVSSTVTVTSNVVKFGIITVSVKSKTKVTQSTDSQNIFTVSVVNSSNTFVVASRKIAANIREVTYSPEITGITSMPPELGLSPVTTVTLSKDAASVTLDAPIFGDLDLLDLSISDKVTLNGLSIIKPLESASRRRVIAFADICQTDKDALFTFLRTTLGKQISYTDHENNTSTIIVTSRPSFTSSTYGYDIEFEFEVIT